MTLDGTLCELEEYCFHYEKQDLLRALFNRAYNEKPLIRAKYGGFDGIIIKYAEGLRDTLQDISFCCDCEFCLVVDNNGNYSIGEYRG